jgi:hypothetical protein
MSYVHPKVNLIDTLDEEGNPIRVKIELKCKNPSSKYPQYYLVLIDSKKRKLTESVYHEEMHYLIENFGQQPIQLEFTDLCVK